MGYYTQLVGLADSGEPLLSTIWGSDNGKSIFAPNGTMGETVIMSRTPPLTEHSLEVSYFLQMNKPCHVFVHNPASAKERVFPVVAIKHDYWGMTHWR